MISLDIKADGLRSLEAAFDPYYLVTEIPMLSKTDFSKKKVIKAHQNISAIIKNIVYKRGSGLASVLHHSWGLMSHAGLKFQKVGSFLDY